jgi:C-terminal peptidase (prc)
MSSKRKLVVWLPVIIALSIALGIFIGNHYYFNTPTTTGKQSIFSGSTNKIDAILNIINAQYVDTVNVNNLVETAIPKIFNELDPHSVYITAKEAKAANEDLEGSFSGIGVTFNMQTDTILVISVISGGPAEKAGILPFDRIITINDSIFSGKKIGQANVMKSLRGEEHSHVKLGVKRGKQEDLVYFDVTRGNVPVSSVDVAYPITKDIGYIKVSKFGRTTYGEFITAIAKLKQSGSTSFIIDLRGNTGGYMDAASNMVNEFMQEGSLIVYAEGKSFPKREVFSNGTGTCKDAQIVVLTDETSASASEIFAGAIQDNDRGLVIGRRTYGKALVQAPISLSDGSEVRLTVARYYIPSGRSIQKTYELGKNRDYEMDLYNRFIHGEFDSADSIKVENSLKFETIGGRTVYGGGGIMPDIFIPRDTSGITSYFSTVVNNGLLYRYALEYSERNRSYLSKSKNYTELYNYLKQQPLLESFTNYAASNGVRKRPALINISGSLITAQLEAYIVRNFFDDEGFYPIFHKNDETVLRAVKVLEKGKLLSFSEFVKMTSNGDLQSKASTPKGDSLSKEEL